MKPLIVGILILFSFNTSSARGGAVGRDGGQAVVCKSETSFEATLLDYYEAEHLTGVDALQRNLMPLTLRELSKRLSEILPEDHPLIQLLNSGKTRINIFAWTDRASKTRDMVHLFAPIKPHCKVGQVATRLEKAGGIISIDVNFRIFLMMSETQRSLVHAHELLHDWFEPRNDNRATRQLMIILLAPKAFRARNSALIRDLINSKQYIDFSKFDLSRD